MSGSNSSSKPIYDNCKVYSPTGELMFRCDSDKLRWYLKKNLAELLPGEENSIRLLFTPKGNGFINNAFFLQDRDNRCVVCGTTNDLSRHHVVPYSYRIHFPLHIRQHNYHDIMPVCVSCHSIYEENYALNLRQNLSFKYDAPLHGYVPNSHDSIEYRVRKGAFALARHGRSMSEQRKLEMFDLLCKYMGKTPTEADVKFLADGFIRKGKTTGDYKSHGQLVIEKVTDLQEFVELWRYHFLECMKPKYIPEGWNPKTPIDISQRNEVSLNGEKI